MCGEALNVTLVEHHDPGPSPRVRGSHRGVRQPDQADGSIPACAGKPAGPRTPSQTIRVHPRVCGEAGIETGERLAAGGPSPRVRGSPGRVGQGRGRRGSIPACAGKPRAPAGTGSPTRVHPRVCGEATVVSSRAPHGRGPSPRVRGSRVQSRCAGAGGRSIPACAGKPSWRSSASSRRGVHPRVCGEAAGTRSPRPAGWGPSPRVRGSPPAAAAPTRWSGSIPACAGKPRGHGSRSGPRRVHPRVCGEARGIGSLLGALGGPSPRVRGSPDRPRRAGRRSGSIPACAGKPVWQVRRARSGGVHPRVCGEASVN